ncbi:hypothetical protein BYT27DRAFT_7252713 [Phlegmacium glaucopus]|nr:hypothetical protein BYT27DRAFT_7252713 [Phlegmacium glaucopus]
MQTKLETYARAKLEWDVLRRRLEDDVKGECYKERFVDVNADGRVFHIRVHNIQHIISTLQPVWAILPSFEARTAKFGNTNQGSYRTGLPTAPIAEVLYSPLSELDVRSLKALNNPTCQTATFFPKTGNNSNN